MTGAQAAFGFLVSTVAGVGFLLIGKALIDSYFDRKAKFVDFLHNKSKEVSNGKSQ